MFIGEKRVDMYIFLFLAISFFVRDVKRKGFFFGTSREGGVEKIWQGFVALIEVLEVLLL